MNIRDFTFETYDRLLEAAVENGFEVLTVADYLAAADPPERYLILRHDVDRKVDIARSMARLEARHDLRSTYYFRTSTFEPDLVEEVAGLGHEVGYHYEDLAHVGGDVDAAHERFARNLEAFRMHAEVRTACSHGSPLSPHLNLDMWDDERPPERYDLLGEAYRSIETDAADPRLPSYFSDTGRRWDAADPTGGRIQTTADLIDLLESGDCPRLYVLAHPSRWSRSSPEFVERVAWDALAQAGKGAVGPVHRAQAGTVGAGAEAVRTAMRPIAISRQLLQFTTHDR